MTNRNELETDREAVKCLVALLVSFAALARRAAARSYPVRCFVLALLRFAEAVASERLGVSPASGNASIVLQRNGKADALALAKRFKALAREAKRLSRIAGGLLRLLSVSQTAGVSPVLRQFGLTVRNPWLAAVRICARQDLKLRFDTS